MGRLEVADARVAHVADRIAVEDVPEVLRLLAASVFDVAAVTPRPQLQVLLTRWRSGDSAGLTPAAFYALDLAAAASTGLDELHAELVRHEFESYLAQQAGNVAAHRAAFRRARALTCVQYALADHLPPRERLGEAAYEAMMVMDGPAGVVAILSDFAPYPDPAPDGARS